MTGATYRIVCAGLTSGRLTWEQAAARFERAALTPGADLEGALEGGFSYWAVEHDGLRRVRYRVEPVGDTALTVER